MAIISTVPDVSNEFTPRAYPLKEFFSQGVVGFYIPLYQRPYSWDVDNVEQLMDDLVMGVDSTLADEQSVSFLGTVILCEEKSKQKNIQPVDVRALPTSVFNVIDGQQRISTLALFATRLYRVTHKYLENIRSVAELADLVDHLENELEVLKNLFRFSLPTAKAKPKEKPVIIRGNQDEWTLDGLDSKYTSPVSSYISLFIRSIGNGGIEIPDRRTAFGRNLKVMDSYLEAVLHAHHPKESHVVYFPDAKKILKRLSEELLWRFEREELSNLVKNNAYSHKDCSQVASGVQLCALIHYLFDRACLSVIYPSSDDWAFDIFQSLNSTGTPLTALETFKPLVVNTVNQSGTFKGSKSEEHFDEVDKLFENMDTVEKKSKLTKEFLNVFSLVYEGKSLSNHFSKQRKWLNSIYGGLSNDALQEEFIHRLSNSASYWKYVKWFDHTQLTCFHGLSALSEREKEEVVLCVKYLDEAGHRMADTLLGRIYALVLRGEVDSEKGFCEVAKAICAFFTIWRASASNTGLDEVYRRLFNSNDTSAPDMSWGSVVAYADIEKLKSYFRSELKKEKAIEKKSDWLPKASANLKYDSAKTVCKFALLVGSHDTIADPSNLGLMKKGKPGVNKYLDQYSWTSADLKTIEHVAPQKGESSSWDAGIYDEQLEHSVGNLTLLPTSINSSAGNKSWDEKVLYFKHLALTDPAKQKDLQKQAKKQGITLAEDTIELLTAAKHASHIAPIVELADSKTSDKWNIKLIKKRSERICELLWEEIWPWLN